jgi:hypothetical protein
MPKKATSPGVASIAGGLLAKPGTPKPVKKVAASDLGQREKPAKPKPRSK